MANILYIMSFDNEFVYIDENEIGVGQAFRDDFIKQSAGRKM
jgi:hypothetical protein